MKILFWLIIAAVIVVIQKFVRIPRPPFPPLAIDENDPLMQEAMLQAKGSIEELRTLYRQRPQHAKIKVPLTTSSGKTEYLWAEVLKLEGGTIQARLITPPVSHTGTLERLQAYQLQDLVDWAVELENGTVKGGYTMRVMFKRGREQWGDLPPELKREEKRYLP